MGWRNDNELLQLEEEVAARAGREPGKRSYKDSIIFTKTIKSDHDKGRVRHSFLNDSQFIIKNQRERMRYSETVIDPLLKEKVYALDTIY